MHEGIRKFFDYVWYDNRWIGYLLLPVSLVFILLSRIRKHRLMTAIAPDAVSVPVIVVGNITVGGTGKTPLVIALVQHLQKQGFKPGVVSRGYGGNAIYPYQLHEKTQAGESGDEPLLIYQRCSCPVVVAPDRLQAIYYLLDKNAVDIVISDDGLQHYAMPRSMEIVVIDGERGLGNGLCLPAGPLRESVARLDEVDFIIVNGGDRTMAARQVRMQLKREELQTLHAKYNTQFLPSHSKVNAVAAIGNPRRFYNSLHELGYSLVECPFADHHLYAENELIFSNGLPTVMTEKDAVKCHSFTHLDHHWVLKINAVLPDVFWQAFDSAVTSLLKNPVKKDVAVEKPEKETVNPKKNSRHKSGKGKKSK